MHQDSSIDYSAWGNLCCYQVHLLSHRLVSSRWTDPPGSALAGCPPTISYPDGICEKSKVVPM